MLATEIVLMDNGNIQRRRRRRQPSRIPPLEENRTDPSPGTGQVDDKQIAKSNIAVCQKKRMGDVIQEPNKKRRAAFGDITNAIKANKQPSKDGKAFKNNDTKENNIQPNKLTAVVMTSVRSSEDEEENLSEEVLSLTKRPNLNCSPKSDSSSEETLLYLSVEEGTDDEVEQECEYDDFDRQSMADHFQAAEYAKDIFNYYRERELNYIVEDYMPLQHELTINMRAILVDWLVEVQENFELNHETLYLAVKLIDQYLSRQFILRNNLQLIGSTALFIACKFDERLPPAADDFLYICDNAYKKTAMLDMEKSMLMEVDFHLGMPLSYRFLRRFARCGRVPVSTLTLARYILELSLMDYQFVSCRESLVASACLWLALKMKDEDWTPTLSHHCGYSLSEVKVVVRKLNLMLLAPPNTHLSTIRSKYSHKIFHEVAQISPVTMDKLD